MSKKTKESSKGKGKESAKNKKPAVEDSEPWINELKTLTINDENWRCNITMIVEKNWCNMDYIQVSNNIFKSKHNRPFIKIVSDYILATNVLEMNYNVNTSVLNGYQKLCEMAMKYCSSEGLSKDMPTPILASIIKYYIYYLKLKSLDEARVVKEYHQKKQKLKDDSILAITNTLPSSSSAPSSKGKASAKKETKPSSKKTGKGKESSSEKPFTELRKRGEEILDTLDVITDRPDDGPQLYIVINSLRQPELPSELLKLQVPLTAVIKFHNFCWPETNSMISKDVNNRICNGLLHLCKNASFKQRRYSSVSKQNVCEELVLGSFWEKFYNIINDKENVLLFKDTFFLKFYPKLYINLPIKDNEIVYENIQKLLYDQLCHLQYDVEDVKRQHQNFLDHLIDRNVEEERTFYLENMDVYLSAIEKVPPEVLNIPFILDCMLRQIEYCVDKKASIIPYVTSEAESVTNNNINNIENNFEKKLQDLDALHDLFTKKNVIPEEPNMLPTVLVYGDEVGIKTHELDTSKFVKHVTCEVLRCFWEKLFSWNLPNFDESELQTATLFEVLTKGEITSRDKLCNLPCTFDDTSFIVEDKAAVFCLVDDENGSYISVTGDPICRYRCSDVDEKKLVHYTDSKEGQWLGQVYDKHSYCFEEMTSDILLQNLFNAFCDLNCFDLLQDCFTNGIFLKFHHRKTCYKKEYLMGTLKTKTAIRDFYDYTIDEEFFWLNEEELLYDKIHKKKEFKKNMSALNKLQFLKNSKAYMTDRICSDTNFSKKKSNDETSPGLPNVPSYVQDEIEQKISSIIEQTGHLESFNIDLPNRVQFSESNQEFIVSFNSQLQVKKLSRLYRNDVVFLLTKIHGHTLYFYQPISSAINTDFHLIHTSEIVFHFKKTRIIPNKNEHANVDLKNVETEFETSNITEVNDIFMKPLLYQLNLSLPTTLCLEVVNPNNCPLYIKQYFLKKYSLPSELQNENFRCYLTDGKIMKFMSNEKVIVYYPTSEIFECDILQPNETTEASVTEIVGKISIPSKNKKQNVVQSAVDVPSPKNSSKEIFDILKSYNYTSANGRRIFCDKEHEIPLETLFSITCSNLFNGVFVTNRSDGTVLTFNKEGTLFVDFPDGSRITTTASFGSDEISLDDINETKENCAEELANIDKFSSHEYEIRSLESGEVYENEFDEYYFTSEAFTVVNIQHYIEHLHFTSVFADLNKEDVSIGLPYNVKVSFSSEGLYKINFDNKAEFLTEYNKIIFREINESRLPQFSINLSNNINATESNADVFIPLLSCKDDCGNELIVTRNGDIEEIPLVKDASICKCNIINKDRFFILDGIKFNGLEMHSPKLLDLYNEESKHIENCVVQNYGLKSHQVIIIFDSQMQTAKDKWLMHLKENKFLPMYILPSTYSEENVFFPFPKRPLLKTEKKTIPSVLLIRAINRVNCNVHLDANDFLKNKKIADLLRKYKQPEFAMEIFGRNNVPYCKGDEAFLKYVKDFLIASLIARVRRRVVKQLEMRKIKEYTNILVNRLLLPYFDNATGAVVRLLLDLLLITVQISSLERHKLEKLFIKPLHHLTDDDLDYMHNQIAPITLSNFCSCDKNNEFCELRILLLAGRTLHNMFPNMISVFYSYGRNVKLKQVTKTKYKHIKQVKLLLSKPSDTLTEEDLTILHDVLRKLPNVPFCSCQKDKNHCKLRIILLACVTLNFIFLNVNSVLKSYGIEISEKSLLETI